MGILGIHPFALGTGGIMSAPATGIEAEVCQDIAARQRLGLAKYGVTVADSPTHLLGWLRHAYEESLDTAIYLKRAIRDLEALIAPQLPAAAVELKQIADDARELAARCSAINSGTNASLSHGDESATPPTR
jgi:hypothetical protein